jgi:precorrin-4 methylase
VREALVVRDLDRVDRGRRYERDDPAHIVGRAEKPDEASVPGAQQRLSRVRVAQRVDRLELHEQSLRIITDRFGSNRRVRSQWYVHT